VTLAAIPLGNGSVSSGVARFLTRSRPVIPL
jgi:hypothetical protein